MLQVTTLIALGCDPQYEKPHPAEILTYIYQWGSKFFKKIC